MAKIPYLHRPPVLRAPWTAAPSPYPWLTSLLGFAVFVFLVEGEFVDPFDPRVWMAIGLIMATHGAVGWWRRRRHARELAGGSLRWFSTALDHRVDGGRGGAWPSDGMSDPVPSLSGRYVPAPAGMASSSASPTLASDGGEAVRPVWECWPLSAAASAVLLAPTTDRDLVASLALQELIADGTWSAETAPRRVMPDLLLRPTGGAAALCPPLPLLHSILTEWIQSRPPPFSRSVLSEWGFDPIPLFPDGYPVPDDHSLDALSRAAQRSSKELWQAVVDDLCARGLLVRRREAWRRLLPAAFQALRSLPWVPVECLNEQHAVPA
jgi:hypothetical protein